MNYHYFLIFKKIDIFDPPKFLYLKSLNNRRAYLQLPENENADASEESRERRAWGAGCAIGSGVPAYGCRMAQMQADQQRLELLRNLGPGKRRALPSRLMHN